jgi:hypothetical protein
VQDLEKQLTTTKQQLHQLRSGVMRPDTAMDIDFDISGQPVLKLPDVGYRPPRRNRPPVPQDLSGARSSIRKYGRGIIKVPPPYRQAASSNVIAENAPALPPKPVADRLLGQFQACIHSVLPIIHWPSFTADYEQVYQAGTLRGARREWTAVLFGVFACGSMHTLEPNKEKEAREFLLTSQSVADTWLDDFTLDQARVALLASIAFYEMNSKSPSWVWLGTAVRIAQDIGLHMESGPWPAVEAEMRKRLWWGIYAWDRYVVLCSNLWRVRFSNLNRLLSLELGKPISIHDQDCDVDLPCLVDEQFISEAARVPEGSQTNPLLAIIHVVRSIGQLIKTLRSPVISAATLEIFDRHFNACLATFPINYHPKSDHYLDPSSLAPIIYLQNARLILHRHNISPHCPAEIRYPAFDHCLAIAIDTTRVLQRCMHPSSASSTYTGTRGDWQTLFASSATTLLCTHIWRCLLILIFREDFATASVCIQACKAIGNSHVVMNSHGRYVSFFLNCLLERLQHGNSQPLDQDEEIIAYVSGDMQGTTDGSWIWQGSETGSKLEAIPSQTSPNLTAQNGGHGSDRDVDWEGWDWVERTVDYLANELHRRNQERREVPAVAPRHIEPQHKLSPDSMTSTGSAIPRSSPSSSRMTIANII